MLSLLSYDFMQRAFLAVIAMSLFSPVLGTFLILRRQSLMSDTPQPRLTFRCSLLVWY